MCQPYIFKRGRTLRQFKFYLMVNPNGRIGEKMFVMEFHALTVPLATLERLLSGGMKENTNTKEV